MGRILLTQRRINLGLLLFLAIASYGQTLIFFLRGNQTFIAFACSALIFTALMVAYQRGWDATRYVTVVATVGLIAIFLREPYLSEKLTMEVFIPAIAALILTEPLWVAGAGALVMIIIALQTGGDTVYLTPDNLATYIMIIGGLIFSRLAVDNAQRLADANTLAGVLQAEAERRAEELAQRNVELRALLDENAAQRDAIRELSVPLLPVADHTLVLPLVGVLDNSRLMMVQERALATIHQRRVRDLIVDVTGVPVIDTQVAQGLIEMVHAVRLLGARVLLVGIRREVAQMLAELGLGLSDLMVDRDVQAALARIWGETRLRSIPAHSTMLDR